MLRLALFSKVPSNSCNNVISKTKLIAQNQIIYPRNFIGSYGAFSKSYKPRRRGDRNRPVIPFFDPTNKHSLIKTHASPEMYYVIDSRRSTEAILQDFQNGLYETNAHAFATLISKRQSGSLYDLEQLSHIITEAAWQLLRLISTKPNAKTQPKGRIYGIFMEHLNYPRTFRGLLDFSKELASRKIPLTNGFYQNLFILAAHERIEDINLLRDCVSRAKSDLGTSGMGDVFDKIIDAYSRINYEEALKLTEEAIAAGVDFNKEFALSIMRTCLENRDVNNLIKYYSKAAVSGVDIGDIIGLVVQGVGLVQKDLKGAEEWFNKVKTRPVSNWLNFSMAHVYIELGKYDEALNLLKTHTQSGQLSTKKGSFPVYLAIKVHYLRDQIDYAFEELNSASLVESCKLEARHYNLVLGMLFKRKLTTKVWEVLGQMIKNKVYPTTVTYEIMVNTLYDVPKLGSKAYELFEEQLNKRNARPNDDFYLKMANIYASEGHIQKTVRSIELLDDLKEKALLAAVKQSSQKNHLDLFLKLVSMCQEKIDENNPRFISAVITGFGRLGIFDEAHKLFLQYVKREKHFISISAKHVVRDILLAASRCGHYETFEILVGDCIKKYNVPPFKDFYEVQIHHYSRSGDVVSAEKSYEEMLQANKIKPNQYTYILMTYVYALQGDTERMQEFFNLIKKNVQPANWRDPIDKLLRSDEHKFMVEGFYVDTVKANPEYYTQLFTIIMQGFSNAGCYNETFLAYEMLKNTRIPIDAVVYTVLIDAIKFSGQFSRLEHVLQDIKKENVFSLQLNVANMITSLIEVFAAINNKQMMIEMLILAERHHIIPTTKLAGTFLHLFSDDDESVRQLLPPNIRYEPEEPLNEKMQKTWSNYVKKLENFVTK